MSTTAATATPKPAPPRRCREATNETAADLSGVLGWQRAHGGLTPATRHAFAGGDDFTVFGLPMARGMLLPDLAASVELNPSTSLGLSYIWSFASGGTDHGIRASFAVRF